MSAAANKSTDDENNNNKKQISTEFPFRSNFVEGTPEDVTKAVSGYHRKLQKSNIPKLLIYGEPGALITEPVVDWCVKNLSNLKTVNIGAGIHYLQEDNPHVIGLEIAKWYESIAS